MELKIKNSETCEDEKKYTILFVGSIDLNRNFVQHKIIEHKFIKPINGGISVSRFNEETFNVLKADNGVKALQILESNKVDVIFWDEGIKELIEMDFEKKVITLLPDNEVPVIKVHRPYKFKYTDDPYDTGYYLCR